MLTRKVIVLGEPRVGKSSLVRRLVHRVFEADYLSTLGVDIYTHAFPATSLGTKAASDLRLMIWDPQGEIGTRIFKHPYFQGSAGVIVVGDVTRPDTLERMVDLALISDVEAPGSPCILMLNKMDLLEPGQEPILPQGHDAKRWATYKTSAKDDCNVTDGFEHLARAIVRRGI
jgi:small GTP-binding protein